MSAYTPGPWEIHDGGRFDSYGDSGPSICAVTGENRCQPLVQFVGPADKTAYRANARLIASAPDFVAALEAIERLLTQALPRVADLDTPCAILLSEARKSARTALVKSGVVRLNVA